MKYVFAAMAIAIFALAVTSMFIKPEWTAESQQTFNYITLILISALYAALPSILERKNKT